jgi:NADH:ubiquinone reductase (H+-translocating)
MANHHVVIVGAGFGGLAAARGLAGPGIALTLIDKQNHHLFQPLLYQVATAGLSPADIAAPIRAIVKTYPDTNVLLDEVCGIDKIARRVVLASGASVAYDTLILATGARHSYFGNAAWEEFAPSIKTIDDATRVRRSILISMERAETLRQENIDERAEYLTFAIIGGGPTGVEMAGAIAELTRSRCTSPIARNMTAPASSRIAKKLSGPIPPPTSAARVSSELPANDRRRRRGIMLRPCQPCRLAQGPPDCYDR